MTIDDLLNGHAPTETWLATEEAAELLRDVERRTQLYRAMHPRPSPSQRPLLCALLAREVELHLEPHDGGGDAFENLYWCALLLFQLGDVRDVLALWRAKRTTFDTFRGFDVQFLVGAGVAETLAFLERSDEPEAAKAAAYLAESRDRGDLADLDGWRAWRCQYYG